MAFSKENRRKKIKRRIRGKISGNSSVPRLTVFRSNKQIYAQIIDDSKGITLASASSYNNSDTNNKPKIEQATIVGKLIAQNAQNAGVEKVIFDRNGYLYHGRVKALAESAREGGLKF